MKTKLLLIASFNVFGGLVFGYNMGIVADALLSLAVVFQLNPLDQGFVTSSFLLGATVGSVSGGILCDKIGRKKVMIIMATFSIIGAVLCGVYSNFPFLLVMRIILGVGVGLSSVICPLYVSEMAPTEKRGFFATLFQLFITFGILISYLVGYAIVTYAAVEYQWRIMFMLGALPGVFVLILAIFFMEESPYWLNNYKKFHEEPEVHEEEVHANPPAEKTGWKELFSIRKSKQLITGIFLAISMALTGINAVFFFAPTIFSYAGFDNQKELMTVLLGLWNFLCTVASTFLVDRLGRRSLLLFGMVVLTLAEIVLGFAFGFMEGKTQGYISLICLFLFVMGFALSPGALFWVLVSEVFDKTVREQATGFINLVQWGFNLILATVFLTLIEHLSPSAAFWILAGFGFISTVYLFIFLKETKGKEIN